MSEAIEFPVRSEEDGKAWFYLDHRTDIEAWVTLRDAARDVVEQHLWALLPSIDELAAERAARAVETETGTQPRLGLQRESWLTVVPGAQVVIEWNRRSLLIPGVNEWPYVAVRVDATLPLTHPAFSAFDSLRKRLGGSMNGPWPFWRYVQPDPGEPGLDPKALAVACLANFQELWAEAAPVLDSLS